jgi:RyR domain
VDESVDGLARPSTGRVSWQLVLAVLAAAVLGYAGLWQALPVEAGVVPWRHILDLLYADLQLFVVQAPALPDGVAPPWSLQVAYFAAPATTIFAVFVAASAGLRDRMRWWWRRRRKGYAIVVGTTAEARAVAAAKRGRDGGTRVYDVPTGDLRMLATAGIKKAAATLYACADDRLDVGANLAIALEAASGVGDHPLRINVHVTDPVLALGLKARRLMAEGSKKPVVEFFTMDEMAARSYVDNDPITVDRPAILVAGAGAFGRAVVVSFARQWRDKPGRPEGRRVEVSLVDPAASRARAELLAGWPVVAAMCNITAHDMDLTPFLMSAAVPAHYRSYICYEDEHDALRSALTAVSLWHGRRQSIVVRLSRLAQHSAAFDDDKLLERLGARLVVADVAALAGGLVASDPDPLGDLAKLVHARYLATQLAMGHRLGSTPALLPWDQLDEGYRKANRAQVDDNIPKLLALGCTIAPRSALVEPFTLTDEEVERLAPLEHIRWMNERASQGWTYGDQRDEKKRKNPNIVAWERLSPANQELDREAVRNLLEFDAVLAEVGLQIVRLGDSSLVDSSLVDSSLVDTSLDRSLVDSSVVDEG